MDKIILMLTALLFCVAAFSACGTRDKAAVFKPNVPAVGVWWWHNELGDEYLEFASDNGVAEIYYSVAAGALESTAKPFIQKASQKDIVVYFLLGDYRWINDNADFVSTLERYTAYQAAAGEGEKFAGIHMDAEPQQSPDFGANRTELLQRYIDFVVNMTTTYPGIAFDWDIPAWFNDSGIYNGKETELYKAVISEANRVFIMSYRDSAEKAVNFSTAKEQVEYAKSLEKQIFLSAECSAPDEGGTAISYRDKGKAVMYAELNKLKGLTGYEDLGISIHHIKSWFELKD